MQRYENYLADFLGRPLAGASIQIQNYPSLTQATYYLQNNTTTPLTAPLISGTDGSFGFYVPDGHYQIVATGKGGQVVTIPDIIFDDPANDISNLATTYLTQTNAAATYTALANLSASSGSSLIGYQPAGTGAVATTVQAKLQQEQSSSDASPFSQWVTNVTGTIGRLLNGTTTITSQTNVPASTTIIGDGRGSILTTVTASIHLLGILATGVLVRAVSFSGIKGTNVLNNSAIVFSGATDSAAEDCEAFGMSGYAFYITSSDNIRLENNYVHGLTGDATYINSCDVGLYQTTSYNIVKNNRLMGGAQTELAVLMQLNSTNNLVDGNNIGAHYSYGIIDYDTTPRITYNTIINNRIQDIDGSTNGAGTKGAGIYTAGTGGQIIAHNQVRNTNINTTSETLVPGAIGINNPFSPVYIGGNAIHNANWYGAMVASATQTASILGNIVFESLKVQIYIKSSSHALVCNNSITALTTTPLAQRGIAFNVAGGGTWTGCSAIGNRIRGSSRGIESGFTNNMVVSDNNISEVNGSSIRITGCIGGVVSNNVGDSTVSASAPALDVSGAQNVSFTGNMFNSQSTTCINFAGTNTGSTFDESNVVSISGVLGGMNNINNTTAGCLVTQYGTAAPTVLNHQVGDRVINTNTAPNQPIEWTCSVAGLPGTWVATYALGAITSGNLTAVTAINDTVIYTTGGVTLSTQIAAAGATWRVKAFGTFVAVNSATARNAQVAPYWGTTALPAIAVAVLASVGQTTEWEVEFLLSGSSTTAIWTVGNLKNKLNSPAIVGGTTSFMEMDNVTPASTSVTAGAQTIDLRFSMSVAVATDIWNVHGITMERLT